MSIDFEEVRFPTDVAFRSSGGPSRQTQVVVTGSGAERRNARWVNSRRTYNLVYGPHSMDLIYEILAFHEAMNGKLTGFRFKDWNDWKSCAPLQTPSPTDQVLGTGAVSVGTFQLIKTYTKGTRSWTRTIKKPVAGTVLIAFNGVKQSTGGYSIDTTTGIVTFTSNPGAGVVVTAGFEFDTPVRFDTDNPQVGWDEDKAGTINDCPLIEILL